MGPFVDVVVPFWVNGAVWVEKTYRVVESWRELCRAVAEDMGRAPGLELRPVTVRLGGVDARLCVDTGSPDGSVAVWRHVYPKWDGQDFLDLLVRPVTVKRMSWFPLAQPYRFKREMCRDGHQWTVR